MLKQILRFNSNCLSVNLSVNSSVYCSSQDISCFSNSGFDSSQTDSLSESTVLYHSPSNLSCSSQDTVIYSEIMILSLNAGGLRKRLNTPEWEETISSYDIVCIQETHFDVYDSLDILGFKCSPLITRNNAKVRSGGLAILVREHLYDSIKILKSEGDHFYWFTLINHFPQDIAFCCVYVAPEGSNYSNIDYFESLEADILYFASHNYKFCLLGDFNAHTNNELDFTCVDDNIQQSLNIGNAIDNNVGFCPLEELFFLKERHNSDLSHINNFGKRLLELCKSCGLCIGNGRLGRDRSLVCKTCKGVTVVDYVILSPSLFPYVSEFEVLPFDPMISDAHSGVHFSFICNEIDLHVN